MLPLRRLVATVRCLASCHQRLLARTLLVVAEEARLRDSMPTRCGSMYLAVVGRCALEWLRSFVSVFRLTIACLACLACSLSHKYFITVTLSAANAANPSLCIASHSSRNAQGTVNLGSVGLPLGFPVLSQGFSPSPSTPEQLNSTHKKVYTPNGSVFSQAKQRRPLGMSSLQNAMGPTSLVSAYSSPIGTPV